MCILTRLGWGDAKSKRLMIQVIILVYEKHASFAWMLIREPSDSPPWLIKGRVGWKSVVIMSLKKKNLKKKMER